MIINILEIHNIASIEDATIDFSSALLAECEVFLISGRTGSGKSTLLDCICLALYDTAPKLENTKMEGGFQCEGENFTPTDTKQMLRRSTQEGWVKLTFEGNDGKNYEAQWGVRTIKKRNGKGIERKTYWILQDLENKVTYTKKTEIKELVNKIVGLDFTQFCRTTILAQGEFSKFLNSKDSEKSSILEKITKRYDFAEIGKMVFEINAEKKRDYESATQRIKEIKILTSEEIEEIKIKLREIEDEVVKLEQEKEIANKKIDWLKAKATIENKIKERQKEKEEADTVYANEETTKEKELCDLWRKSTRARALIEELDKNRKIIKESDEALKKLENDFRTLLQGFNGELNEKKHITILLEEKNDFLKKEEERGQLYANVQTVSSLLRRLAENIKLVKGKRDDAEKIEKELESIHLPNLKKQTDQKANLSELIKENESKRRELEDKIKELDPQKTGKKKEELHLRSLHLFNISERVEQRKELREENALRLKKIKNSKETIGNLRDTVERLGKEKLKADKELKDAQLIYDGLKDTMNKFAVSMREKLKKGDICPVCLQRVEKDLLSKSEIENAVTPARLRLEAADENLKKIVGLLNKSIAEEEAKTEALNNEESAGKKEEEKINKLSESISKDMQEIGYENIDDDLQTILDKCKRECEETTEKINSKLALISGLEKELKDKYEEGRKLMDNREKESAALAETEKAIAAGKASHQAIVKVVEEKMEEIEEIKEKLSSVISVNSKEEWESNPEEFAKKLENDAATFNKTLEDKKEYEKGLFMASQKIDSMTELLENIRGMMPAWNEINEEGVKKVEGVTEKSGFMIKEIAATTNARATAETTCKRTLDVLQNVMKDMPGINEERLRQLNSVAESLIIEKERDLENKARNIRVIDQSIKELEKEQRELDGSRPAMEDSDTADTLNPRVEEIERTIIAKAEEKGSLNKALEYDEDNKKRLEGVLAEIDQKKKIYEKWSRMNSLMGDATGKRFRQIAQSYVLEDLIRSANHYMSQLSPRYQLRGEPGSYLIMVEDAFQGYLRRSANTLSGGETFLVSLALALALSDFGKALRVKTLFIDEGFGSLSGEPLKRAIDTLRRLHLKSGRQVGIISHIEELREKIPVQIHVNQDGNNSASKVTVTG